MFLLTNIFLTLFFFFRLVISPGGIRLDPETEWTIGFSAAQDITANAGAAVIQNEWTLGINSQPITASAGDTVTQGSVTGYLRNGVDGATSLVVIRTASGAFTTGADVVIKTAGTSTVVATIASGTIDSAINCSVSSNSSFY